MFLRAFWLILGNFDLSPCKILQKNSRSFTRIFGSVLFLNFSIKIWRFHNNSMFLNALWKFSAFLFGILVFLSCVFYVFECRLSVLIWAKRSKTQVWLPLVVVYWCWKYDLRFLFYAGDRLVCGVFSSMCVRGFVDNDGIFNLVRYFCRFTMWWHRGYMTVWRRVTISCAKVCFSCVRTIVLRPKKPLFSGVPRRTKFPHINISTSKVDAVKSDR